jgi:hypothetical protein
MAPITDAHLVIPSNGRFWNVIARNTGMPVLSESRARPAPWTWMCFVEPTAKLAAPWSPMKKPTSSKQRKPCKLARKCRIARKTHAAKLSSPADCTGAPGWSATDTSLQQRV